QQDRELVRGNLGAVFQGQDGDRRTPGALPGDGPVAQTVVDGLAAFVVGGQDLGDGIEGFFRGHAGEGAGVHQNAFVREGRFLDVDFRAVTGGDHLLDGQAEL